MIDFPKAWEISRSVPPEEHDPECSTAQTNGAILCDCFVLWDKVDEDEKADPNFKANSEYWSTKIDYIIMDADGWDRQNFKESWAEEITFAEFEKRMWRSTVAYRGPKKEWQK